MASSAQSKAVLELGKKLVSELTSEPFVDTLGRWMAHYIAELIHDAETANSVQRSSKLKECRRAILELWTHRNDLPQGHRPFEEFGAVLRAIETLDDSDDTPRYFRALRRDADKSKQNSKSKKWITAADSVDRGARILIRHCLAQASDLALDKSKEWVKLAENAQLDAEELLAIRFLGIESKLTDHSQILATAERKVIKDRLKRLEDLRKATTLLKADLSRRLKAPSKKKSPKRQARGDFQHKA